MLSHCRLHPLKTVTSLQTDPLLPNTSIFNTSTPSGRRGQTRNTLPTGCLWYTEKRTLLILAANEKNRKGKKNSLKEAHKCPEFKYGAAGTLQVHHVHTQHQQCYSQLVISHRLRDWQVSRPYVCHQSCVCPCFKKKVTRNKFQWLLLKRDVTSGVTREHSVLLVHPVWFHETEIEHQPSLNLNCTQIKKNKTKTSPSQTKQFKRLNVVLFNFK